MRPHDTQVDQYFLSFRTDNGAEIKHAIIRRSPQIPVTQADSADGGDGKMTNTGTTTSTTTSTTEQQMQQTTSQSTEQQLTAVAIDTEVGGYLYLCGKLGPCTTLWEMLQ